MRALLIAALWSLPALAQTAIYTWTDADGVHYTDDASKVPHGVKASTTVGDDVSVFEADPEAPAAPAKPQRAAKPPQDDAAERAAQLSIETSWRQQFREARETVRSLEDEIEADRKAVEEVNGMPINLQYHCNTIPVVGYGTRVRGAARVGGAKVTGQVVVGQQNYYGGVYNSGCYALPSPEFQMRKDRLEQNRRALVRAKEALADLDRRAAFDAIPLEWRR